MTQTVPQPKTSGLAIASVVCGILALSYFRPFAVVPAIMMGQMSMKRTKSNPHQFGGRGLALAGAILV